MSDKNTIKRAARARRSHRTRSRMSGTPERPRLSVFRSNAQVYAQVIDDASGRTLAQASTRDVKETGKKSDVATAAGKLVAERAKAAGVEACVFDRGGYRYHGRVKALAEGAREAGLKF